MQNLDTLLKEILITPLVGAMIERGIQSRQERFVSELGKRPMSTWSGEEMHKYSVATGQPCPECGLMSGDKCPPDCEECGEPSTHVLDSEDRCPTDRGTEARNVKIYLCRECFGQFMERGR